MDKNASHAASWVFQIIAVVILGQTLFFKFSGAEESIVLFSELNMEPHGRIIIGILELVACVLLLIPHSAVYGALLGCGLMCGALIAHFTQLGWQGERLTLGLLAVASFASCAMVLYFRRLQIPFLKNAIREVNRGNAG